MIGFGPARGEGHAGGTLVGERKIAARIREVAGGEPRTGEAAGRRNYATECGGKSGLKYGLVVFKKLALRKSITAVSQALITIHVCLCEMDGNLDDCTSLI